MIPANITININFIPMLNGSNFKSWHKNLLIVLRVMDLGLALRTDSPPSLIDKSKDFLTDIEKKFVKNEKAEIGTLLTNLISMKFKGKGNIREYILEMSHLASKLKALKLELSEDLSVHLVLISLLTQFNQFKVSYNCQKETWSLNELISHCVQEEESVHLASTFKDKKATKTVPQKKQKRSNDPEGKGCFFCGAEGHIKKQCTNYFA
ncbi:uncharacterized protein LOC109826734 [Asparagus officinalis]|uniref:uncharacterized protein LOC109826734 n=1 Tax=Asparagus officinalis TaxID=4686 RepID=UPI00098E1726|nr:uncharacterized protein LOC109826734 [Asparagus officinalis]